MFKANIHIVVLFRITTVLSHIVLDIHICVCVYLCAKYSSFIGHSSKYAVAYLLFARSLEAN